MLPVNKILPNFLFSFSLFLFSFFLAWQINVYTNFLYPTWYEVLDLDQAILKYAPENKYKHGFENTDKQQHVALFAGIVDAIQLNGNGLDKLSYTDTKLNKSEALLTEAEIVHLQDVANLVKKFKYLGAFGLIFAVLIYVLMRIKNIAISKFSRHLYGGVGTVLLISVLVLLIGPTKLFYIGHELIFPNNHQWFFYYEESLMSTMMKAPVLFGPLAAQLLVLTTGFWLVMLWASQKVAKKIK